MSNLLLTDSISFVTLFSGSSGNSQYLGTKDAGILIDIGRSCRQMERQLNRIGGKPEAVKAILLTHEHGDHSKGLAVFEKKHPVPLYASGGTLGALDEAGTLSGAYPVYQVFAEPFSAGGFTVSAFPTSHDCAEGTGYRITLPNGTVVSVIPDTGTVLPEIREAVNGTDFLYCENDYNTDMLWCGPYPYSLKVRIDSDLGHLSTAQVGRFARTLVSAEHPVRQIVLGHLSEHNNDPELAVRLVSRAVQNAVPVGVAKKETPVLFSLEFPDKPRPESTENCERKEEAYDDPSRFPEGEPGDGQPETERLAVPGREGAGNGRQCSAPETH